MSQRSKLDTAVIHAAEAGLGQLIIYARTLNHTIVHESALYMTIFEALRNHSAGWVSHEYPVTVGAHKSPAKGKAKKKGDHNRVDFAVNEDGELYYVEVKLAGKSMKPRISCDVSADINKLSNGRPLSKLNNLKTSPYSYLIVYNLDFDNLVNGKEGMIKWNKPPEAVNVECIETLEYRATHFRRTVVIFKIKSQR